MCKIQAGQAPAEMADTSITPENALCGSWPVPHLVSQAATIHVPAPSWACPEALVWFSPAGIPGFLAVTLWPSPAPSLQLDGSLLWTSHFTIFPPSWSLGILRQPCVSTEGGLENQACG